MVKETLHRNQIPEEETWNLKDLFESEAIWKSEVEAVPKALEKVTVYKNRVGESATDLLNCLEAWDSLYTQLVRVATYASLKESSDGGDPENQSNSSKINSLAAEVKAKTSFIKSEILALDESTLQSFLNEEPALEDFHKTLADLFEQKPYQLSAEAENILASFSEIHEAPFMIYERSKTSDMRFPSFTTSDGKTHPLTFNTFDKYEGDTSAEVRREAYKTFTETLRSYQSTYAATYATEVRKQVIESRLRGYGSVTEMLLLEQQVSEDMYHRQLDTIQEELAPHMRRFAALKQRVLGLEQMTYADLKAPLDPDFDPEMTYEEAGELVLESLQVMGPEYMDFMKKALDERWVDRANNHGKRSGAFCSSPYGVHPYILLTWNNSMRDAFTLAHELGHAGHFSLAGRYQRISNTRPSLYFIEAPSTMNEMLLSQHILKKSNDVRMRRWVILQSLGTYYHNFVTHILEGELQRRVYKHADQDTPITASLLNKEKHDVISSFWGDAVEVDEGAGLTWMKQPHYYMGLYPYTYSAGLTASTAAAQIFQEKGQPAVENWIAALKAGGTKKPLELMQLAGVDMTTKEPIQKAVAYVGSLVDELEKSFR
ncbi:oligoendopeptidase F [Alkalicoccus daliensis]|uniref:Oligopeptidase F n=1 Tax=Alkalicoccus daliensis TaxID=745820 RepID=A0A1H0HUJ6_9BACI|nr:oligoendopeptidase F [Alkalicoccus daliensis]SDO22856.1 oligoendopeptidase F [Alkalicoccus daliensis]